MGKMKVQIQGQIQLYRGEPTSHSLNEDGTLYNWVTPTNSLAIVPTGNWRMQKPQVLFIIYD